MCECFVSNSVRSRLASFSIAKRSLFVNVEKYGNTSAASIPIALAEAVGKKKNKKGDNVVLVAFGAGLTWAACVMKWSKEA